MILDNQPAVAAERLRTETRHPTQALYRRGETAQKSAVRASAYNQVNDQVQSESSRESEAAAAPAAPAKSFSLWQDPEVGLGDFFDVINPLHHIPILATLYRNMTGDQIGMVPRIVGGALWGRIGGLITGVVNAAVEWITGKDIGDHIYSAIRGGAADSTSNTATAGAITPPANPATGATAADIEAQGQHSSSALPVLYQPIHVKEVIPLSALPPLGSSAYLLAARAANDPDDTDDSAAARPQLRFTA